MDYVHNLYMSAFPEAERRDWQALISLCESNPDFEIRVVRDDDRSVGFISLWQWSEWRYVEHFAVDASCRGRGVGADVLRAFLAEGSTPVVLEVEMPVDEMSKRRIEFYRRLGFVLHDGFPYIQPSYGEGRPSLPMCLMTYGAAADMDLSAVAHLLYHHVYGV